MALMLGTDNNNNQTVIDELVAHKNGQQVQKRKSNASATPEDGSEVFLLDPSEHFRPEHKSKEEYRIYTINQVSLVVLHKHAYTDIFPFQDDYIQKRVFETYKVMHTNQCMTFVQNKMNQWTRFDKVTMSVMDALEKLNSLVDESDPDVDLPNIIHAFQTAERIREAHPDLDWFHLTGLIHDLGKLMALYGEPQWAVVGDTFPLGCEFAKSIVYRDETFGDNPDLHDAVYSTKYGIYEPNCGLNQLKMSFGHDEYMYQVLKNHPTCTLPEQALYMIRFHSFYPWHSGGDYYHLCSKHDLAMLPWVREFNRFDLYSKTPDLPDVPTLIPYYQSLIDKYMPGLVNW